MCAERRAHWTDDLIDAVIRAESDAHDYEYRAMAAIAAVEDWQTKQEQLLALADVMNFKDRAEKAEAQVQRVREVAESIRDAADKARGFHGSPIQWERQKVAEDILRILDGGDA